MSNREHRSQFLEALRRQRVGCARRIFENLDWAILERSFCTCQTSPCRCFNGQKPLFFSRYAMESLGNTPSGFFMNHDNNRCWPKCSGKTRLFLRPCLSSCFKDKELVYTEGPDAYLLDQPKISNLQCFLWLLLRASTVHGHHVTI